VWVPADHFVRERIDDIGDGKLTDFAAELRMKNNLQQQIAKFFAKRIEVAVFDCFDDFVRFFDQIGNQRTVRLLFIPRAANPQPSHNFNEIVEGMMRRLWGQRHERDTHRSRKRCARYSGNDFNACAALFQEMQQHGQPRKIR